MRKVLKFVKGKRDDKKDHGTSGRSIGPFADLPSPADQSTPTDEHCPGFEQAFGYHVDLSGKDKTVTKLHKAAWQGNLDKLKVNMRKIDIDVIDRYNRTPLHLAAAQGHANIVWFLLGNKANMNICDNEGKTPFLKAIECGHKETIQIMLERGVDINTIDYSGNSGLHIAAKHGFYEIASMLLKQGANFESSNNFGEFPLHIATVAENKDLVELLLRYGSSVNIVDRDNRSPLMFAAKCGSMPLVQLFLEYGAQRAVMDSNDWTAEDYALMGGHQDVATELKSPSETMVMPYAEKNTETPGPALSIVTAKKRSVSEASLPPDPQEKGKEDKNLTGKQSEEADNSDTWNDSQMSDSSLKQKGTGLKLSKFLPPSSDDEISEESIQSPRVQEMKDEEIQDSPRSCVIPPPCKPPRSWDLIQSGVIDDPKVLEPRRRSLLPLGSLRSRRESFNESPSAAESPSFQDSSSPHQGQGDGEQWLTSQASRKSDDKRDSLTRRHLNLSENEGSKDSPSTKYEDIQLKVIHNRQDNSSSQRKSKKERPVALSGAGDAAILSDAIGSKGSLKGSSSESEWDSDDSLPLDNYPPVASVTITAPDDTNSPLKVFRVIKASELELPDNDDFKDGSPYSLNSEKRGRFLMRAPSIDLTDDDTEGKNKHSHSSASSELAKPLPKSKEESEASERDISASGTLGRDGTLRGYEEVWESNAHIPPTNIILTGPSSGLGNITIKEELEESLVWSSPQFEGNSVLQPRPQQVTDSSNLLKKAEDNLLFPSPRFDQKSKSEDFSESSVSIEGTKKQISLDEYNRRNSVMKLESRSLDALEPQKYISDPKLPRSRKHSRQQSMSVQPWSKSEELHEKPTSAAQFERMIEENKRINAQLRCYDEALRDLAHVSVVRKQTSLSLPRAKETTAGLTRSQSAGARNEGYFSLPSASNYAPREMAQSAIVKKQGSLSLPRTSEIPDFSMFQSFGNKKQGHSSLPGTNEFGVREMAQTAIVKRQGSLSLPRTCEIPDLAAVANEEYLSLPRSNELIDEAFKEIGQSTATMKRGSRSLPREIDARSISLGADPVPPPRHKKSRRRRAESEGETTCSSLKSSSRSLSLEVKRPTPRSSGSSTPNAKSPEKPKFESGKGKVETPSAESMSSNGSTKEISMEKPIRKKRKMLLAMRGFMGTKHKGMNESTVNEASFEESFDEPPFWISTDKNSGPLERQGTVIERPNFSVIGKEPMATSPARLETVESEEKEEPKKQSPVKELSEVCDETLPSNSLHEEALPHEETVSTDEKDGYSLGLAVILPKESPDIQRDSQSDEAESGLSHSDNTPQHAYMLKGHHNLLKEHLQKATAEKGRLEETAAELGERAEKLKYELAEAKEAARSRDEVIALLEEQLTKLEEKYTKSLEESQRYKLRLGNLEQELKHLKEVCSKYEEEKAHLTEIIRLKEMEKATVDNKLSSKEEKQAIIGERDSVRKQQEMEIHVNCLQVERDRLNEEVIKLERKNEDLRQKLDAVVTRNQLLSEEKTALSVKNSLSIKTLQEHSERWKLLTSRAHVKSNTVLQYLFLHRKYFQKSYRLIYNLDFSVILLDNKIRKPMIMMSRYETCMDKIKVLTAHKQSVDQETQISPGAQLDKDSFTYELQEIVHKIEEAKEKDYAIWHSKIQEDVLNAVELLNTEYSKIESSLLKHTEKLEFLTQNLLENFNVSPTKQFCIDGSSGETGTVAETLKLVQELTQLNADFREQYQQLKVHFEYRHEELRKKSESLKLDSNLGSGETSKVEQDLRKENMILKEKLKQTPDSSEELYQELKNKNSRLQEQVNVLVAHIEELEKAGGKETSEKREYEIDDESEHASEENIIKHRNLCEAHELFDELKNKNIQLQNRLDLLVDQISDSAELADKETITDQDSVSEKLYVQNMELRKQISELQNIIKSKTSHEQQTMTETMKWEPSEEFNNIVKTLKIENEKLKNRIQMLENSITEKAAMKDKGITTDGEFYEVMKFQEENASLRKHISVLQNKIRQQKLEDMGEGEFGPLLEEEEEEDDIEAGRNASRKEEGEKSNCKCHLKQLQFEHAQVQLQQLEEERNTLMMENNRLQKCLNEQTRNYNKEILQKVMSEKEDLRRQLSNVKLQLSELQTNVLSEGLARVKGDGHNVHTMTDPDMELLHISMENAALQSQLKQLSEKYENNQEEYEKTLLLLQELRDASTVLTQENRNPSAQENFTLKKELEEMRQQLIEQDTIKNRNNSPKEIHSPKVAELCSLLDRLRKENNDLQSQLKRMLTEKEEKDEDEFQCHVLRTIEGSRKECSLDEKAAMNRNLDSLALLLSRNSQMKPEETAEVAKNLQSSISSVRVEEPVQSSIVNDNILKQDGFSGQAGEVNGNKKKKLGVDCVKSQHKTCLDPDDEMACSSAPVLRSQASGTNTSGTSSKNQFKDTCSTSSEIYSEKHKINDMSDFGFEPTCSKINFRSNRDAATNTTPSVQNLELQRELQLEKERCRKYQQSVKKLKADVQVLKNKLGESRKPGKTDSNLAMKQNNANNNTLLPSLQSPAHFEHGIAEFQRQVADLEQKVREENSMRFSLEVQVNKMRYELQEKLQLEKELSILRNRLEKDFVSRYELEQLRNSYEVALNRAKYEAEMAARDDLNEKLCQINSFIEKQVQEQTRLSQLRNTTESQIKQDFQETRLKLLSELAKVQASLQAKGEEEKELREKCEKLTRECEKKHEIRRKKLIEKSYNVNLAPNTNLKEKEINSKGYMLDMRSPVHHPAPMQMQSVLNTTITSTAGNVSSQVSDPWPNEHPFSHILRRELERSIRKHTRTDSLTEHPATSSSLPQTASEEHLELLKKKYFLH